MKKILFSVTVLFALMSAVNAFAIEGDGSEETPFLITTQEELELISDFPKCHFELKNDIILEDNFVPLCTYGKEFTGTFDGNGYTISNLTFTSSPSYGGLFRFNSGVITDVNVVTGENGISSSPTDIGIITGRNAGTISHCRVQGKVTGTYDCGGIAGYNSGKIIKCFSNTIITSTSNNSGGIAGYNTLNISECFSLSDVKGRNAGGIAGYAGNSSISDSFFSGTLNGSSYAGGIAGYSSGGSSPSKITNCYVSATYTGNGKKGIVYSSSNTTVTNSFYDKTVSGLTDTGYGVPKSTMAMKMKKTYTDAGWDFDTIWAIDSNINNGYPYLRWAYEESEELPEYTINSLTLTDESGNVLETIPETGNVYAEINVIKNSDSKETDCLIIACYDENGALTNIKYMKGLYNCNQEITFGTLFENNSIKTIKTFVWKSLTDMIPLSNTITY